MFYLLGTDTINIDTTETTVIPCMYQSAYSQILFATLVPRRAFINYKYKKRKKTYIFVKFTLMI